MKYIPYTYLIKHIPSGKCYYGVRTARNCSPDDLWVSYFTSSSKIKSLINRDGKEAFLFEIRKTFPDKHSALLWEKKVLDRMNAAKSDKFLNMYNGRVIQWSDRLWINNGSTSKFIDRLNLQHFLNQGWKKGRLFTKDHRLKLFKNNFIKNGGKNGMFNRNHNEATKQKISKSKKGSCAPNAIPIIFNGIEYASIGQAIAATGIKRWKLLKTIQYHT